MNLEKRKSYGNGQDGKLLQSRVPEGQLYLNVIFLPTNQLTDWETDGHCATKKDMDL